MPWFAQGSCNAAGTAWLSALVDLPTRVDAWTQSRTVPPPEERGETSDAMQYCVINELECATIGVSCHTPKPGRPFRMVVCRVPLDLAEDSYSAAG